jgi:hypothetical protein
MHDLIQQGVLTVDPDTVGSIAGDQVSASASGPPIRLLLPLMNTPLPTF